ncbi:MAG: DUF362 domain-containing protein [Thermoplasmatales archaeon]|nr:MAG: DUF362 domain-containing protein [Thermoplasmatales archaeon]
MSHNSQLKNPTVCIQKSNYPKINLESLLTPLDGIKQYINQGERILLKVNLLNASIPEKAVVTHPAFVEAVVKAVLKEGGTPYIGDSPSGQFTKRRLKKVYERSGLKKLERDLGVELNYDTRSQKISIHNGKKLKKTPICKFVLDADKIIALPKIKTHSYMTMTMATKIMYGAVPGLTKAKYHSIFIKKKPFADMLLDVHSVTKPDLNIMDGIIGMQGDGPAGGIPVELGVLLASENAVALDLAICKMLNIEPVGIPTLRQAKVRHLWPRDISYPLLSPSDVRYNSFILPSTAGYILTGKKQPIRYPVTTEKCTVCGLCQEICPRNAITMDIKKAQVDYSACIKCYCCHEICPEDAIKLEVIE